MYFILLQWLLKKQTTQNKLDNAESSGDMFQHSCIMLD